MHAYYHRLAADAAEILSDGVNVLLVTVYQVDPMALHKGAQSV
jgi:hypothetical protein